MNTGKDWVLFLAKSIITTVVFWLVAYYGYVEYMLKDTIVPMGIIEIDRWVGMYQFNGAVCAAIGFVASVFWFVRGITYKGNGSVVPIYWLLFAVCILVGACMGYMHTFIFYPYQEGGDFVFPIIIVTAPVIYYFISLIGSAEAVKYVPPFSGLFH